MAEYHVENFGCRASQADGTAISGRLEQLGLSEADRLGTTDVLVLNTCSVTAEADRQARAFVRKARRANPHVQVVVTGCYAQRAPDEVAALPGVHQVIGNSHKALVAEIAARLAGVMPSTLANELEPVSSGIVPLASLLASGSPLVDDSFAHAEMSTLFSQPAEGLPGPRTRPNLKVQDGCGNRCSFCVIPQTRGGSRSVQPEKIVASVRAFVDGGGQEMVLSGINLGRWGRDLSETGKGARRLEQLIETILAQTELPRLRISSVEPMDWVESLLGLFETYSAASNPKHPRLARHAHLPLQSGSDTILRAMYRRYRPWHYAEKVERIREAQPDAAIGADVMVGFPGETDARFDETYSFLEQLPLTYLHLFPFSARPGTPAWELHRARPVHGEAVLERMARLKALGESKHRTFRERFVGRELSLVTLQGGPAGPSTRVTMTRGISDNFLNVDVEGDWPSNQMHQVSITGITGNGLVGRVSS